MAEKVAWIYKLRAMAGKLRPLSPSAQKTLDHSPNTADRNHLCAEHSDYVIRVFSEDRPRPGGGD